MSLVRWCLPPLFAEPRRFLETSRVTHKHAQKTGRSRAARTRRAAIYQGSRLSTSKRATVMQSSICLEDVDEGGPASTERDGQPPASEPPPVTANFEPPPAPPKSGPLKPEAFLARQRQLGSLGGKCAGSVGENKFLVQLAVDGRARCQLRT